MKFELHSLTQAFAFALPKHPCSSWSFFHPCWYCYANSLNCTSVTAIAINLESHIPCLVSNIPTPDGPNVPHRCLVGCSGAANDFNWRLVNGLWGFILAVGLLWTSLTVRQARSWLYFKGWFRSFLADYGVPLLVVIWSAVGYCVNSGTPSGIPRRTRIPNTWDEKTNWTVARVCMQLMA